MTLVPMFKKCPKCHKIYSFNPDTGQMFCPYCHGLGKIKKGIFDEKDNTDSNKK